MARAYSDDLGRKLLEAHAAGKGRLRELAERFGVSVAWAWKVPPFKN
jgi:transposase